MENFLLDNDDILFHLEHMDIDRIITLKEDHFKEAEKYPYAPTDAADARDSYKKVISIIGEISGETLAPLAAEIDEEGVKLVNGEVQYAKGTRQVLDIFAKADLMGFSMPRKYNGLNFPAIMLAVAAEIVSRADGSFLNFGLQQDIGETLNKFGSDKQKQAVLPQLASGELGCSMILTEPDAGSDLQAVNLRAHQAASGQWFLNGVKRFITNGNGEIGLVLARSEDGHSGARGLSFFLYKRDEHMTIRRVENKLGIHGSPTCELQFNDAPVTLVGERQRGLTKYTMWLMNSARLGIAGQALGIAEAAYREADKYAGERIQFKKPVREFPAVYEMLTEMKISIEAGRTLFYETARFVDLKEGLEEMKEQYPERSAEFKTDLKRYSRLANMFTPIVKAYNTEMANKVTYDTIQIHGGTGFMKEFNAERHARDARITSIYEGTTQLQVVAAIGGVTTGTAISIMDEYESEDFSHAEELHKQLHKARLNFEKTLVGIKDVDKPDFITYHARRVVEMATDIIIGYLMIRDAAHSDRKMKVAEIFIEKMLPRVEMSMNFILKGNASLLDDYKDIIGE
ncbi:MAG: acyl-CoA dehydrogenase [Spirochaetes bacterium]|nr:MAG: acyl-CoA dehydrogenase [Spirochaetota bacterium]RKX86657.1 MAG: acyl-CoA dehydrogenase [Spirochaetota bacterium]